MGKTAIDAQRMYGFRVEPERLIINGLDNDKLLLRDEKERLAPPSEALVSDIALIGVKEPVIVTKDGSDDIVVVDGRQRVMAARLANTQRRKAGLDPLLVPVVIERGDELGLFEVMVSLNTHTKPESPVSLAAKAAKMLALGSTPERTAVCFGVTVPALNNLLTLNDLSVEVKDAIVDGRLTPTAALALKSLPREEQMSLINGMEAAPTVEAVKAQVKAKKTGGPAVTKPRLRDVKVALARDVFTPAQREVVEWLLGLTPNERFDAILQRAKEEPPAAPEAEAAE